MSGQIIAAAVALILFVITQAILKFIIEPVQEQKKLLGEIAHALVYYDNAYLDETLIQGLARIDRTALEQRREELREASKEIRDLAGRLSGSLWTIPYYDVFGLLDRVPKRNNVLFAVAELRGWSNGLEGGDAGTRTALRREAIARLLGITRRELPSSGDAASIVRDVYRLDGEDIPTDPR